MQLEPDNSLPTPDPASAEHSDKVAASIRDRIAEAGGCISFAEFMHHALYAPGLGYYSAGATKFGEAGDFVTAPEVSPLFGRVLARQCAEIMGSAGIANILEIGAGSGRLAVDVLQKLAELDALPERYAILEVSPDLRERQASLLNNELPGLGDRVAWLDTLPHAYRGILIANEVLDALPAERFVKRSGSVWQLCVRTQDDGFCMAERPAPAALATAVAHIEDDLRAPLPEGYVSDVCLAASAWVADAAASLECGMMFVFDYGVSRREYYAPERSGGWLRCHFRHHAHNDPLILPGIQDITAWVDFTRVATAAADAELDIAGYATQAQFLIHGGLDAEASMLADLPAEERLKLSGQIKLLTLPGEMGENFKCIGLGKGDVPVPTGLRHADRTMSL
ncbi:MAG: SAM-dependent methyltransferase [Woeseiaceae bacterium]|nr:SAM-dependent methyltransferase [Woeseiaceae bacterium]